MKKIFDSWNLKYKKPFGAVKKGEECEFRIRLPKNIVLDYPPVPVLVIFRTGFKETFLSMNLEAEEENCNVYQTTYTPKHEGVHYYYFSYKNNGTRNYIKRSACHESSVNSGELFQLTVYDEAYETPDFLKGGIMYQIFPDRFYKSTAVHENVPEDRVIRENWEDTPFYRPDEKGHVWNNDYFGGDLQGIKEKLPYLQSIGVTCIYLNPIFESHENHRYNTANYRKVDPLLGTNEDFKILCSEAKKYGISIILDGVFSHTGADSIYFNKFNRYDSKGAYNSQDSEFFPWYTFSEYPDKYEAWWGIDTLPNVNENNKEYTDYICGDGGVLDYWIEQGAAGYRLDVADELPDEFLDNLNKCVKKHGKEKIIIGEVWEDASNKESYGVKRRYLLGHQLDSVMNYPLAGSMKDFFLDKSLTGEDFEFMVNRCYTNYMQQTNDVLFNMLDSHDTIRLRNVTSGLDMYNCLFALLFTMPGSTCIYYGTEIGMEGSFDPDCRRCMPWGDIEQGKYNEQISITKQLIKLRKEEPLMRERNFHFPAEYKNPRVIQFQKMGWGETLEVIVNSSDEDIEVIKDEDSKIMFSRKLEGDVLHMNGVCIRYLSNKQNI